MINFTLGAGGIFDIKKAQQYVTERTLIKVERLLTQVVPVWADMETLPAVLEDAVIVVPTIIGSALRAAVEDDLHHHRLSTDAIGNIIIHDIPVVVDRSVTRIALHIG